MASPEGSRVRQTQRGVEAGSSITSGSTSVAKSGERGRSRDRRLEASPSKQGVGSTTSGRNIERLGSITGGGGTGSRGKDDDLSQALMDSLTLSVLGGTEEEIKAAGDREEDRERKKIAGKQEKRMLLGDSGGTALSSLPSKVKGDALELAVRAKAIWREALEKKRIGLGKSGGTALSSVPPEQRSSARHAADLASAKLAEVEAERIMREAIAEGESSGGSGKADISGKKS